MSLLEKTLSSIKYADKNVAALTQSRLDSLTKPQGSLGVLEECALKYASARGDLNAKIEHPSILTFVADHGVAEENVSVFSQEMTLKMVANFAKGGAAINVLAKSARVHLKLIDMGTASSYTLPKKSKFTVLDRKIASGTGNIVNGPAMSIEQVIKALEIGIKVAEAEIANGTTLLGTGDMGVANTTSSAAIYATLLHLDPKDIVGHGSGIDNKQRLHKVNIVEQALVANRHELLKRPIDILAAVGGFEIAGICGAILAASAHKVPIVIDGFISGAAAVVAMFMQSDGKSPMAVADYCFFSHLSAEIGHLHIMQAIGMKPILDLKLRLGEGTGAVLAFNIIEAGINIMQEMSVVEEE